MPGSESVAVFQIVNVGTLGEPICFKKKLSTSQIKVRRQYAGLVVGLIRSRGVTLVMRREYREYTRRDQQWIVKE